MRNEWLIAVSIPSSNKTTCEPRWKQLKIQFGSKVARASNFQSEYNTHQFLCYNEKALETVQVVAYVHGLRDIWDDLGDDSGDEGPSVLWGKDIEC